MPGGKMRKNFIRDFLIISALFIATFYIFKIGLSSTVANIDVTTLYKELEEGNIDQAEFQSRVINGTFKNAIDLEGKKYVDFRTQIPFDNNNLLDTMVEKKVNVSVKKEGPSFFEIFSTVGFFVLTIIIFFMIFRQISSANSNAASFGKVKTHIQKNIKIKFTDVAGCEEAKEELQEIIEFLKNPKKFTNLGGKIPKGVLLIGSPGTGKTLLAKAIAGEAAVPFLTVSGSEFVELFVGVGASRVRDLFEKGKQLAPSIIFIDEIDAVGRHRGAGLGGGHDEREQTLNQLLVEMDGFETNDGVIIIAATNRPDILDPALLRPGRFDRRIVVPLPDVTGREGILKVHAKNITFDEKVDFESLAKGTPGMTGADLANLVNEAALLAARKNKDRVETADFEEAKDKVLMGLERRSLILSPEEKKNIAYHEAGHALVSIFLEHGEDIHKVSIIPRGMALGVTVQLPKKELHNYSKEYLLDQVAMSLGGRAAETIFLNTCTTGAENDLERATELARKMIAKWGMSSELGPVYYSSGEEEIFLGKELITHKNISEKTSEKIDEELKKLILNQYQRALDILTGNKETVEHVVKVLLKKEVLSGDELKKLIKKKKAIDSQEA